MSSNGGTLEKKHNLFVVGSVIVVILVVVFVFSEADQELGDGRRGHSLALALVARLPLVEGFRQNDVTFAQADENVLEHLCKKGHPT